jgi:hypothetical protein
MVRAPNQGARTYSPVEAATLSFTVFMAAARRMKSSSSRDRARRAALQTYLTPAVLAYFLRNLSTRPAVSTIFCLPV